jgi:putative transcriptional regulator
MHGSEGALGFVINRIAPVSLRELIGLAGYREPDDQVASPVFVGGPVQPASGFILGIDPALSEAENGVIAVGDRIRITSSRASFDTFAGDVRSGVRASSDEKRRVILLGYSGWGPGQLEGEIAAGAWLPVPLDERVVFDTEPADRWERAYAILGLSPAAMMSTNSGGDA